MNQYNQGTPLSAQVPTMPPNNRLTTETVPVRRNTRPLQPVRRNLKPTQPVHMIAKAPQPVHNITKPPQPVHVSAKPQQLHAGGPRGTEGNLQHLPRPCTDDDAQWHVSQIVDVFPPVWIYAGRHALRPPGSQSHADVPHPQSWQHHEIGIAETVYTFSEIDHPIAMQAHMDKWGNRLRKRIECWLEDVEKWRLLSVHGVEKERLPIVHESEEANKGVLERWNRVDAGQGRPSALLNVIRAAEPSSVRHPSGALEDQQEQQRATF